MSNADTGTQPAGEPTLGQPAPTVWPCLAYADAQAAIRFLTDAFGFHATFVATDEAGDAVEHAEVRWPEGGGVMLGSASRGSDPPGMTPGSGWMYVVTDDPDAVHARAVPAGAQIVQGLTDKHYGSRDFTARDPEGNTWTFGTYRGT